MNRNLVPPSSYSGPVVVTGPVADLIVMWCGFPLLGAGLGWLVRASVGHLVGLPLVPFKAVLRLLAAQPEPRATIVPVAVGAALGLCLAAIGSWERLRVTVTADRVGLRRGGSTREIARGAVRSAYLEDGHLVLLGPDAGPLAREKADLDPDRLRQAFTGHGYRWLADGDPYADRYRLWLEGQPDLPAGAGPLLRSRQRALEQNRREEAEALREDLARLGVVVRDRDGRQQWRPTDRPT
ncbi:YqeB family protein [Micromonospora zhanjiangensis]|uniref:DUF308 domain-containing protein n=1 Tax=Micromonospora zhanjiangensis TaxID=1522057 RepID=A0ABV8KN56_9ACTN